jgi:hypothetical protein
MPPILLPKPQQILSLPTSLATTSDRAAGAMMIMIALILSTLLLARPHHQLPQFGHLKHPGPRTQEFNDHITSRSANRIPELLTSKLAAACTEVLAIPQTNLSTTPTAAPTTFRANLRPISLKITLAAVTTLLLLLIASCGGSNSVTTPSGTPAATYTLTLTASSPSTPSPPILDLTLTIQ